MKKKNKKVTNYCQKTLKKRGVAHSCHNLNVKQRCSCFALIVLPKRTKCYNRFSNKDLMKRKDHSVPFCYITKTDEKFTGFTCGQL